MTRKQYDNFLRYVYCTSAPYKENPEAIKDEELREFAKRIIELADEFSDTYSHVFPSPDEKRVFLERMKELVCSEIPWPFKFLDNINIELRNLETDNPQESKFYDDLIRIRAVFNIQ